LVFFQTKDHWTKTPKLFGHPKLLSKNPVFSKSKIKGQKNKDQRLAALFLTIQKISLSSNPNQKTNSHRRLFSNASTRPPP
jgi:hypothetical protein